MEVDLYYYNEGNGYRDFGIRGTFPEFYTKKFVRNNAEKLQKILYYTANKFHHNLLIKGKEILKQYNKIIKDYDLPKEIFNINKDQINLIQYNNKTALIWSTIRCLNDGKRNYKNYEIKIYPITRVDSITTGGFVLSPGGFCDIIFSAGLSDKPVSFYSKDIMVNQIGMTAILLKRYINNVKKFLLGKSDFQQEVIKATDNFEKYTNLSFLYTNEEIKEITSKIKNKLEKDFNKKSKETINYKQWGEVPIETYLVMENLNKTISFDDNKFLRVCRQLHYTPEELFKIIKKSDKSNF
jgi:hypothetical protein